MTSDGGRRRPSEETDIFDEIWNSIADTASIFTRNLVGLPMVYRHNNDHHPFDRTDVLAVFAEPAILSPEIITFSLDRDVDNLWGPFRIESRPVSVFDICTPGLRPRYPNGMMFLFGNSGDNARWLLDPGMRFTGNSMFRPWFNDEWIRRSNVPCARQLIDPGFDEIKEMEQAFNQRPSFERRQIKESKDTDSVIAKVREAHRPWNDLEKHFEANLERVGNLGDGEMKSYSTETRTTTNITRKADGSIHKETVTEERLPDGSSKTTRIVDFTPAEGGDTRQPKTETTITTTPPTDTQTLEEPKPIASQVLSKSSPFQTAQSNSLHQGDEKSNFEKTVERDKGELAKDQKDWTWWYWSKK